MQAVRRIDTARFQWSVRVSVAYYTVLSVNAIFRPQGGTVNCTMLHAKILIDQSVIYLLITHQGVIKGSFYSASA